MKTVYLSKKKQGFLLLSAAFVAVGIFCCLLPQRELPVAAGPYYQGGEETMQVSIVINVDWGEEYIADMLAVLEDEAVLADFFLTGRWADKNPDLAAMIADKGHEIGNHAYSHSSPNANSCEQNKQEISRAQDAIYRATGVITKLYGPPSGERDDEVLLAAEQLGYTVVLWSLDTIDWQKPPVDTIIDRIIPRLHPGAIILAHPTQNTLAALPQLLCGIKEQGYRIVTVSQNIAAATEVGDE